MSGGKQAAQYTGKQPSEASVVTSRLVTTLALSGNRERQAECCAEEEDVHHESSSDEATSVARRGRLRFSSGSHAIGRLSAGLSACRQNDHAENGLKESQSGSGQGSPACRCLLEQELLGRRPQWHCC